jgi:hypothetical protein
VLHDLFEIASFDRLPKSVSIHAVSSQRMRSASAEPLREDEAGQIGTARAAS